MTILAAHAPQTVIDRLLVQSDITYQSVEELLESYALTLCGIAFTTSSAPVLVNAFGPMVYCKSRKAPGSKLES